MRSLLLCFWVLVAHSAFGQVIVSKVLKSDAPMTIFLSPGVVSTLYFPDKVAGTFGAGLVPVDPAKPGELPPGVVAIQHPPSSQIVLLEPLSASARVLMTVLCGQKLYLFLLQVGPNPDVAVTLLKDDPAVAAPREVSAEEIQAQRIKYDPELMHDLLSRARNAALMRKSFPDLYAGYSVRSASYQSDSGSVKTIITSIHRFAPQDAIVLQGTVQNETNHAITFDGRAATVQVAQETHAVKFFYCPRPIPAGATVPVELVLQGGIHGERANLSIENQFTLVLPPISGEGGTVWNLKSGNNPGGKFKVPAPVNKGSIPLSQTGRPIKTEGEPQ